MSKKVMRNWVCSLISCQTYTFGLFKVQYFQWITAATEYYLTVKTRKPTVFVCIRAATLPPPFSYSQAVGSYFLNSLHVL